MVDERIDSGDSLGRNLGLLLWKAWPFTGYLELSLRVSVWEDPSAWTLGVEDGGRAHPGERQCGQGQEMGGPDPILRTFTW